MTEITHFRGQTNQEKANPLFCQFFMHSIPPSFLGIQNFEIIFAKNLHRWPLDLIYEVDQSSQQKQLILEVK